MAGRPPTFHGLGQIDPGIGHAERLRDARSQQVPVAGAGPQRQCLAQQPVAHVRVLVPASRAAIEFERRQELVQQLGRVAGVFVVGIGGHEIRWTQWQAGRIQVEQSDFAIAEPEATRALPVEPLRDRIIERNFASVHQVRQQQRSEHFRDRADVEDGIAAHRSPVVRSHRPVRDDSPARRIDDANDDARGLPLRFDTSRQHVANLRVRRNRRRRRRLRNGRR